MPPLSILRAPILGPDISTPCDFCSAMACARDTLSTPATAAHARTRSPARGAQGKHLLKQLRIEPGDRRHLRRGGRFVRRLGRRLLRRGAVQELEDHRSPACCYSCRSLTSCMAGVT